MSFIYCITNDINDKQYVGKTDHTIEKRFKEHCQDSKKERMEKRPLYNAINKYGVEHFHIKQLEECSRDESEDREIYWIKKLNTFSDGYNATLGGDSKHYLDYDKILYMINNTNKSLDKIAKECHCSKDSIKNLCKINNIRVNWRNRYYCENTPFVVMIDKNTNKEIMTFISSVEAIKYIKSINKSNQSKIDSDKIRACCRGLKETAYGYKWKFVSKNNI